MGVTSEDSTNHGSKKKKLGKKTYAVAGTYEAVRPRMGESALTTYRFSRYFYRRICKNRVTTVLIAFTLY